MCTRNLDSISGEIRMTALTQIAPVFDNKSCLEDVELIKVICLLVYVNSEQKLRPH